MAGRGTKYSVAIVDDDPVVRRSIELFIGHIDGYQVCATFESGDRALGSLLSCPPDIVLLDLRMPGLSGWECARQLIASASRSRIIIVTSSSSQADYQTWLGLGLHGYLVKPPTIDSIRLVLVAATAGFQVAPQELNRQGHVPPDLTETTARPVSMLSATEKRIIQLMRLGYKDTHMAGELGMSVNTLRTHLKRLFEKLGVHSRAEVFARFDHSAEVRR